MRRLRLRLPGLVVAGIAGPRLVAGGGEGWATGGWRWRLRGLRLPGLLGRRRPEMIARLRGLGAAAGGWRWRLRGLRLAVQVAANSPKMAHTWWRRSSAISPDGPMTAAPNAPYRIRPPVVRDGLAGQYCTENGLVVYVRPILAPGPHVAVAASTGATESWATGG